MAGNETPKVRRGDPLLITAQHHNTTIDVNRAFVEGRLGGQTLDPSGLAGKLYVKNNSGVDVNRFEVLGISGVLFGQADNPAEFHNRVIFTGITPDEFDHYSKFVVCTEPIKAGKIGRCQLSGLVTLKVDKSIANDLEYADVKDADRTQLRTHPAGTAKIIDIESGIGTKWALVDLGVGPPSSWFVGHATNTIAAATGTGPGRTLGSGTMSLYLPNSSDVLTDSGRTWTVYNLTDEATAANIPLKADVMSDGKLVLDVEEC